jgi:hypothetical protein
MTSVAYVAYVAPGGVQLAMPLETPDNPTAEARAAFENAVLRQEADRARDASWARTCRCRAPLVDDESCVLCGHEPSQAVAA